MSPLHDIFLPVLTQQWFQVNTFSVCWNRLKVYYCSTTGEDFLNSFGALNTNCEVVRELDLYSIINTSSEKSPEVRLLNKILFF
jgi:hypothetical protein